jgi:hypothetical protein
MSESMQIPAEWLAEARLQSFYPVRPGFVCDAPEAVLIPLADIEPPMRFDGYSLDANGFDHKRMGRLLEGIRDNVSLPPIFVELGDPGQRKYLCEPVSIATMLRILSASHTCRRKSSSE